MDASLIGVEIGATKLQIAIGSPDGRIQRTRRYPADRTGGGDAIRRQLERGLAQALESTFARAVGVGFGGPVDCRSGEVATSHQVEGWLGFPLRQWMEEMTGLPAVVENDTNTAALAEARCGAGRGFGLVFYTNFGSGMGGGMVVDGQLYHGAAPGEAELGLALYDRGGANFESRCSGWAVDARVREAIERHPQGLLAQLATENPAPSPGGEARLLGPALARDDALAEAILQETATDIAFAISHVTHLFHPQVVVLGGGLALLGHRLRDAVARHAADFITPAFRPGPEIRLSALLENVVCTGALLLAGELIQAPSASP